MKKMQKVPVSVRSVIARINRKLKPDLEALKITRGDRMRQTVGDYYIIDYRRNFILNTKVDPAEMGRDLGVLKEYEEVVQ